jgi:hypothetical protein
VASDERSMVDWVNFPQDIPRLDQLHKDGFEVGNATLGSSPGGVVALQFGLLAGDDHVTAYIRGERATFRIGEKQVTLEEFIALGEAHWSAFAKRAESRLTSAK